MGNFEHSSQEPKQEPKKEFIPPGEIINARFEEISPDKTKEKPTEEISVKAEAIKKSLSPDKALDSEAERLALRQEFNHLIQEFMRLHQESFRPSGNLAIDLLNLSTPKPELIMMRARLVELSRKLGIEVRDGWGRPL